MILFLFFLASTCKKKITPDVIEGFENSPVAKLITPGIDEISGIADSKAVPGFLWLEQDSGNPPELLLLAYDGTLNKKIYVKGIQNRDWEDIAVAAGPDVTKNYVYLAETGDNNQIYPSYFLYRFPEPLSSADTVFAVDKINFQYPDGSHDAEAILVDNATKDIYVITKRDALSKVFKISYPQSATLLNTAVLVGTLSFNGVVSAALSADNKEIIVKTYTNLYYWKRSSGESIETTFTKTPESLSYSFEPQGEAVCFRNDNTGFYTLSEKGTATSVSLNFYKRK